MTGHVVVVGAGAFGTALAIAQALAGRQVTLWGRGGAQMAAMAAGRTAPALDGCVLPDRLRPVSHFPGAEALRSAAAVLIAVPMQSLAEVAASLPLAGVPLVACCKGADMRSGLGPVATLRAVRPGATHALLTGPSFAADIARGLPTALTLACDDDGHCAALQASLSTRALRLYRTLDVAGAELGGALKNVIAIAAGVVIGAGLGDSARAALMTRGYAEMQRLALARGAMPETLAGLSGLGDLVLTCTSLQSRNFRFGMALGRGEAFDPAVTVEGAATARALASHAAAEGTDLPITSMVAALVEGKITVDQAVEQLLARPLKRE